MHESTDGTGSAPERAPGRAASLRAWWLIAAALLLCASAWASWRDASRAPGIDYYGPWAIARGIAGGDRDIRGAAAHARMGERARRESVEARPGSREAVAAIVNLRLYHGMLEHYATPFLLACIHAMSSGQYERDLLLFSLVSLVAYAAGILALARALRLSAVAAMLAVGLLMAPFAPFLSHVIVSNVSALHAALACACVALACGPTRALHDLLAGFGVGLMIMLKPNLAAAAPATVLACLVDRRFAQAARLAGGMVVGAGLAVIVGAGFMHGFADWGVWMTELRAMLSSERPFDFWNTSLVTSVRAWTGVNLAMPALATGIALVALAAWIGRRRAAVTGTPLHPDRPALALALGCGVGLLASPYTWLHYLLACAPLVLWPFRGEGHAPAPRGRRIAGIVAFACLSTPLHRIGLPIPVVDLGFANAGVGILVVLGLLDLVGARGVSNQRAPCKDPLRAQRPHGLSP